MKTSRNASEERVYRLLERAGFPDAEIKEPDTTHVLKGNADFVVGDVVFEVKEITLSSKDLEVRQEIHDQLSTKRRASFHAPPSVVRQFKSDLKDARSKFKEYQDYATVIVEDLTEWGVYLPDIEELLFGSETIQVDLESGDVISRSWVNKQLRLDQNRGIGAFMFLTTYGNLIYHNLMAYEHKMVPIEFLSAFRRISDQQYMFMNIPGGTPLVRHLA